MMKTHFCKRLGLVLTGFILLVDMGTKVHAEDSLQVGSRALVSTEKQPGIIREASTSPPGGLQPGQVPQFVTVSFDDNTAAAGIMWALSLFRGRTHLDGSPINTSFYMNTHGLVDNDAASIKKLLTAIRQVAIEGHEIGNHTHNHLRDIDKRDWSYFEKTMASMNAQAWDKRIQQCSNQLHTVAGIAREAITGFRTPFLKYNQATLSVLARRGFVYDTSIEEGHIPRFDGTNFRWPYTLDQASPGHHESWSGSPYNPNQVVLGATPGLWEFPLHALMIPPDEQAKAYGIRPGLWQRMQQKSPNLRNHRISALDYHLFVVAGLSGKEVTAILKYNLDLRLRGNRAPMMLIAHSQYYVNPQWIKTNVPHLTAGEMKAAIAAFINYARSKPEVRLRAARDVIEWCKKPVALDR